MMEIYKLWDWNCKTGSLSSCKPVLMQGVFFFFAVTSTLSIAVLRQAAAGLNQPTNLGTMDISKNYGTWFAVTAGSIMLKSAQHNLRNADNLNTYPSDREA